MAFAKCHQKTQRKDVFSECPLVWYLAKLDAIKVVIHWRERTQRVVCLWRVLKFDTRQRPQLPSVKFWHTIKAILRNFFPLMIFFFFGIYRVWDLCGVYFGKHLGKVIFAKCPEIRHSVRHQKHNKETISDSGLHPFCFSVWCVAENSSSLGVVRCLWAVSL
jgi:hypothetical protein